LATRLALLLVAGFGVHEWVARPPAPPPPLALAMFLLPKVIAGLLLLLLLERLHHRHTPRRVAGRALAAYRASAVLLAWLDLAGGVLVSTRAFIGNPPLLDELLLLAGPLAMLAFGWFAWYPLEMGARPVAARPGRARYILSRLRHETSPLLPPILVMWGLFEAVHRWVPAAVGEWAWDPRPWLIGLLGLALVLAAPGLLLRIWATGPLPPGPLRDRLAALARDYAIPPSSLRVWRTGHRLLNAALLGVVPPFRYILITDRLLAALPPDAVEAILAHEIAHAKKHHPLWLALAALATLTLLESPIALLSAKASDLPLVASLGGGLTIGLGGALLFGWISRRFERQADAFAAAHRATTATGDPAAPIRAEDAGLVMESLEALTLLNGHATTRRSWRHGATRWRMRHLAALVGRPANRLPIDRTVRAIQLGSLLVLAGRLVPGVGLPVPGA